MKKKAEILLVRGNKAISITTPTTGGANRKSTRRVGRQMPSGAGSRRREAN